jgi:hypothetical protein
LVSVDEGRCVETGNGDKNRSTVLGGGLNGGSQDPGNRARLVLVFVVDVDIDPKELDFKFDPPGSAKSINSFKLIAGLPFVPLTGTG